RDARRDRLHRDRQGCRRTVSRAGAAGDERARTMIATSRALLLGLPFLLLPGVARAQQLDLSHGGPIAVTASDGIEWRQNEQEVIARGNARAVRGNVTVTADRLIAHYRKKPTAPGAEKPAPESQAGGGAVTLGDSDTSGNEIYRVEAEGNVHIFTPTD